MAKSRCSHPPLLCENVRARVCYDAQTTVFTPCLFRLRRLKAARSAHTLRRAASQHNDVLPGAGPSGLARAVRVTRRVAEQRNGPRVALDMPWDMRLALPSIRHAFLRGMGCIVLCQLMGHTSMFGSARANRRLAASRCVCFAFHGRRGSHVTPSACVMRMNSSSTPIDVPRETRPVRSTAGSLVHADVNARCGIGPEAERTTHPVKRRPHHGVLIITQRDRSPASRLTLRREAVHMHTFKFGTMAELRHGYQGRLWGLPTRTDSNEGPGLCPKASVGSRIGFGAGCPGQDGWVWVVWQGAHRRRLG